MNEFLWLPFLVSLLAAGVRLATPLLFAALGGITNELSGVLNIGLEGMMIGGTFGAYIGALLSGSEWGGALGGMLAGGLLGLLFAYLSITWRADQVVLGTGLNLFALGLTSFFFRSMYKAGISQFVPSFDVWNVPLLSDIPLIGQIFFRQVPLVYLAYLLIPLFSFLLYKTTWGLKLRCCGEHPRAAETVGVNVTRMRYLALILSGMLAGLGGTFLSLGQISAFTEGLVSGRGFIALAAIIFGRWKPLNVAFACLLFGVADALQLRLQGFGLPIRYEFLLMFPYLLTLVTFVVFVNRGDSPAALGKPYPEK
ncbi:MAG: ABC transporter permease [Anaerolineae bacterium]|jgi:simple sugar transport system permease protein|nr:MAG: ABC transporter permease [Anaerolineae bacterium]